MSLLCKIGMHGDCIPNSDSTGCWGECTRCGERFGYVTTDTLHQYIAAEDKHVKTVIRLMIAFMKVNNQKPTV